MAYKRRRRRKYRGRKRRKMNLTRRVKRVVKREFKKRIEMKRLTTVIGLTAIGATGSTFDLMPATANIQGTAINQRVGLKINVHRLILNMHAQGASGSANGFVLRMRIMIVYSSKSTPILADFPPTIDGHMAISAMTSRGIHIVSDKTFSLAPCCPTLTTTADTYAYWAASHSTHRTFRRKLRFKGRPREYDSAGNAIHGFYTIWALSDVNGGEVNNLEIQSRFYFTDA